MTYFFMPFTLLTGSLQLGRISMRVRQTGYTLVYLQDFDPSFISIACSEDTAMPFIGKNNELVVSLQKSKRSMSKNNFKIKDEKVQVWGKQGKLVMVKIYPSGKKYFFLLEMS